MTVDLRSLPPGTQKVRSPAGYNIHLIGARKAILRDAYHSFLTASWTASMAWLTAGFMIVNLLFALAYWWFGGVDGVHSFADAMFFSVQTMATIGYGVLHPESTMANTTVVIESFVGIMITALSTGLLFAKFSRPDARIRFSNHAVICPHDGQLKLMFRIGNERSNLILEATTRVTASRTEILADGSRFYRLIDLVLVRERSPAMSRGFTIMHVIDDKSPLFNATAASMKAEDFELLVTVIGIDETTVQTVHARHEYADSDIRIGHRLADTIDEAANGDMVVDLRRFHDTIPIA